MAFVIVDLEFNNLSDIHKFNPNIYSEIPDLNKYLSVNEIIEIGAIKVDMYMKPIKELKVYIKPSFIPIMNPKILSITGINEENLKHGVSFEKGINMLKELVDEDDILCSWAKDDVVEIINNCNYNNYDDLSWINRYLDIQEYTTKILGKKKVLSLKNAVEYLKIKLDEEKLHDALNDAIYTFQVFKNIYNVRAMKQYIINDVFNTPVIDVKNLNNIHIDRSKLNELCPICHREIENKSELVPLGWRFVSIGTCNKCKSRILQEVSVKKSFSDKVIYKENYNIIDEIDYLKFQSKIQAKLSNV